MLHKIGVSLLQVELNIEDLFRCYDCLDLVNQTHQDKKLYDLLAFTISRDRCIAWPVLMVELTTLEVVLQAHVIPVKEFLFLGHVSSVE